MNGGSFKDNMQILSKGKLVFLMMKCIYEGVKFYGSPWIKPIEFQEDRWAFSRFDTYEDIPDNYTTNT